MTRRSSNATRDKWIERASKITESRPPMTERELAACFEDLCKKLGLHYWHTHRSEHSPAGELDYRVVKERCWQIHVELKSEKGQVTPEQLETIRLLESVGQRCFVFRPRDWPDRILEVLQR